MSPRSRIPYGGNRLEPVVGDDVGRDGSDGGRVDSGFDFSSPLDFTINADGTVAGIDSGDGGGDEIAVNEIALAASFEWPQGDGTGGTGREIPLVAPHDANAILVMNINFLVDDAETLAPSIDNAGYAGTDAFDGTNVGLVMGTQSGVEDSAVSFYCGYDIPTGNHSLYLTRHTDAGPTFIYVYFLGRADTTLRDPASGEAFLETWDVGFGEDPKKIGGSVNSPSDTGILLTQFVRLNQELPISQSHPSNHSKWAATKNYPSLGVQQGVGVNQVGSGTIDVDWTFFSNVDSGDTDKEAEASICVISPA